MSDGEVTLRQLVSESHSIAAEHGFWHNDTTSRSLLLAEKIALVHSEASEALEALRAGEPDFWIREEGDPKAGKAEGIVSELIDTIIRCADILGALMPADEVETAYIVKREYNKGREFKHGKQF